MQNIISFFALFALVLLTLTPSPSESRFEKSIKKQKYIILLGASVGREWNIDALPEREKNSDYIFEYVYGGKFDKSKSLGEILARRERKPDAIFLKECAAYFPGDFELYSKSMMRWIEECRRAGVIPIPATIVPVTRLHSLKKFFIDVLKGRNPFQHSHPLKQERNSSICEFNDWIRTYSREKGLAVLDLEAALRYSERNRFLKESFARIDGLHLNKQAYKNLDRIVIPALESVQWENLD
ncbi:MAG: hypothetical protein JSV17_14995 [Candidatus Aminicenantes bacterium]|nr:MAG: hypothetical protein JSV17_14995 [Candidatus Aminicenantes bacterium]